MRRKLVLYELGKVRRSHSRGVIAPKALTKFVFPSKLCPSGVASFPLVKIVCVTMGARAATTDDAPRRSGQTPSPARSDTPQFYPEIREAEELERMSLAEFQQRQQMASAPVLAPRPDSSESSSSTSSFEMSDGEAREALAEAAERAMGARKIALVPTSVSDGEEDWGGWKVPKTIGFQAFCRLQRQIYRENGQESVYQLHMERNEPAPLAHGIYGSVDFLNELSRLGEPGYLAGMAAGRTDVIPLHPKDCEEEVVGVPPGYHSSMSPCYSHGLLYFGKPKLADPPFMEHDDYLNLPSRRMDQAVLTTELEDHHAQILSQLTQAASTVDFGCNLKVITLVVDQLGESLTSNKSVHPKLLPMSYPPQQGHTFVLYLLGLVNLYQENHEKYDIGHAERVTSETTPMWIQKCIWEIIGNVIKDEAKEHYSLEEYRASSKAARAPTSRRWKRFGVVLLRWAVRSEIFLREPWMDGAEYPQRASGKAIGAPRSHGGRLLEPPPCAWGASGNSGASIGSTVGGPYTATYSSVSTSSTTSGVGLWRKQLRSLGAFGSFRGWYAAYSAVCASDSGKPSVSFARALEVPTADSTKSRACIDLCQCKRDDSCFAEPAPRLEQFVSPGSSGLVIDLSKTKGRPVILPESLKPRKQFAAHGFVHVLDFVWHGTLAWSDLSLACLTCCGMETFWLGNISLEAPAGKEHLVVGPLVELGGPKSLVERTPFRIHARRSAKFPGVFIDFAMVFIILIFSALGGVVISGLWKLLKRMFQRGSKRTPEMSRIKPRRGVCWIRIRTRKCFKRVCVERILLVGRKSPKAPTKGKPKTLKLLACLRHVWHVLAWCLDVACFVLKGNDERVPEGGLKQPVTGHLRMLRGLPLPGSGTGSDPLILDRDDGEPSSSSKQPNRSPQNPEQPLEAPIPQGEEVEERIPLRSHALQVHRSRGHFPYDVNCESCCSSKGKVPARRLKRQLQKENQTIGVDFYNFGKLRVLLLIHVASRYSMSIPAMELHDPNLLFNIDRFIREIGLRQKTLTFRCDNEQGLISMCERVAAQRQAREPYDCRCCARIPSAV